MYVPNHLKWRILLAQELKQVYFEQENSHRNCKRIFELYGRYLLGTTYDTFLNYVNQLKYEINSLRLPPYIAAAIGLLEPLRIASERLRVRKLNASWTLLEIVEETLAILRERSASPLNRRINRPSGPTDGTAPALRPDMPPARISEERERFGREPESALPTRRCK